MSDGLQFINETQSYGICYKDESREVVNATGMDVGRIYLNRPVLSTDTFEPYYYLKVNVLHKNSRIDNISFDNVEGRIYIENPEFIFDKDGEKLVEAIEKFLIERSIK